MTDIYAEIVMSMPCFCSQTVTESNLISDFFVLQGPRAASVGHRPEYVAAFVVAWLMARVVMSRRNSVAMSPSVSTTDEIKSTSDILFRGKRQR